MLFTLSSNDLAFFVETTNSRGFPEQGTSPGDAEFADGKESKMACEM